jgi:lipid II:glycine glycyltransferase (peptidoglycan interpeptide bridge formation enzyme)
MYNDQVVVVPATIDCSEKYSAVKNVLITVNKCSKYVNV